jgi:hypothetical protein
VFGFVSNHIYAGTGRCEAYGARQHGAARASCHISSLPGSGLLSFNQVVVYIRQPLQSLLYSYDAPQIILIEYNWRLRRHYTRSFVTLNCLTLLG